MLKWLATFAVFVMMTQTSSQVPRQTTKAAAPAVPVRNLPQSPDEDTGTSTTPSADKEHSIKLTSLPPVTIADRQKTWLEQVFEWGPWVFALGLVVVGVLQVWLLWRTREEIHKQEQRMAEQVTTMQGQLTQMREQTDILKNSVAVAQQSADIARENTEAYMARERAHLVIEIEPTPPGIKEDVWEVCLEVTNMGESVATDVVLVASYAITDTAELPTTKAEIWRLDKSILKHGEEGVTGPRYPMTDTEASKVDVDAKTVFVHTHGMLGFKDVFNKFQMSDFHFFWNSDIQEIEVGDEFLIQDYSGWVRPIATNQPYYGEGQQKAN